MPWQPEDWRQALTPGGQEARRLKAALREAQRSFAAHTAPLPT